jgi:hypothetical protein
VGSTAQLSHKQTIQSLIAALTEQLTTTEQSHTDTATLVSNAIKSCDAALSGVSHASSASSSSSSASSSSDNNLNNTMHSHTAPDHSPHDHAAMTNTTGAATMNRSNDVKKLAGAEPLPDAESGGISQSRATTPRYGFFLHTHMYAIYNVFDGCCSNICSG